MRRRVTRATVKVLIAVLALLGGGAMTAGSAEAFRPLLSGALLHTEPAPPEGQLEDPCGLAVAPGGQIYVADYYHRTIDLFSPDGTYSSQILLPGGAISGLGVNKLDGVCGLAIDSSGDLWANEWHEGVVRVEPSEFRLDSGESTGVAVDAAGDVFVDDRTYVAEYAAPVQAGATPVAKLGLGRLGDGYGLAVSADGSRVYVADASTSQVKMFEPTLPAPSLAASFAPPLGFTSLVDSALAIDPTDGHLLVLDDLQPGFEHPEVAVEEFEPDGTFVDQIRGPAGAPIVDGEPSGLAVDAAGDLFVTDGNGELGNVFKFGPDPPGDGPSRTVVSGGPEPPTAAGSSGVVRPAPGATTGPEPPTSKRRRGAPATASGVIQHGKLRVAVDSDILPRTLPRQGTAPIRFKLDAKIASTDGSIPPQLRSVSVEINRNGRLDPTGLPLCRLRDIQPSTTSGALAACRSSLVGEGRFAAKVLIPQQAPFPSDGKILAFNGRWHGQPAILAHIYGDAPIPTSYTLPFVINSIAHGTYGTKLTASLPDFTSEWGYVTEVALDLGRDFRSRGTPHGYLTAGCPAPAGFPGAAFSLSRTTLEFAGREPVSQTLIGNCRVR